MIKLIKKILSTALSRTFITLLLCLALCPVIWFYSPLLGFNNHYYFIDPLPRVIAILAIALLWGISNLRFRIQPWRTHKITSSSHSKKNKNLHDSKIHTLCQTLKKRNFKKNNIIIVTGDDNSAKRFILNQVNIIKSSDHTSDNSINWVLTQQQTLIYIPHDHLINDNLKKSISPLIKINSVSPVNSIIIIESCENIFNNNKINNKNIKSINQLNQTIGYSVPVYFYFSNSNEITGYKQYAKLADQSKVSSTIELYSYERNNISFLTDFNHLIKTKLSYYYQITNNDNKFENILSFRFLLELSKLKDIINKFIKEIPHYTTVNPLYIQGLYLSPITESKPNQGDDTVIFSSNSLIHEIINHSHKVSDNFNESRFKRKKFKHAIIASAILFCTITIASLWMVALNKNINYVYDISNDINKNFINSSNITSIDKLANYIQSHSWFSFGLFNINSVPRQTVKLYNYYLSQSFLPYISTIAENQIKSAINHHNTLYLYQWLSSYLMLNDKQYLNKETIYNTYADYWDERAGYNNNTKQNRLFQLNSLLQLKFQPIDLNTDLVSQARAVLDNKTLAEQAYLNLNNFYHKKNQSLTTSPVDLDSTLSIRKNTTIPYLFTKNGYITEFKSSYTDFLQTVINNQWILGKSFQINDQATLEAQMNNSYWSQYLDVWNNYIANIEVSPFNQLAAATQNLGLLAKDSDSAIVKLLQVISDNTSFTSDKSTLSNNVISNAYSAANSLLIQTDKNAPAPIHNYIQAINNLYRYFVNIQQSAVPDQAAFEQARKLFSDGQTNPIKQLRILALQAPEPLATWLNQIVHSSLVTVFNSANKYIETQWDNSIKNQFNTAFKNSYPFTTASGNNASPDDFLNFINQDGEINTFFKKYLNSFIFSDKNYQAKSLYNVKFPINLNISKTLTSVTHLKNMFNLSKESKVSFIIEPRLLSKNIRNINLSYGDNSFAYAYGPIFPYHWNWPLNSLNQDLIIKVQLFSGIVRTYSFSGPWSLFKFLASSKITQRSPTTYTVDYSSDGLTLSLTLIANSSSNPFKETLSTALAPLVRYISIS
ncbi:ImcF-related family protein [Piscirickettsia salmonis]|uniref:ImcF-related family protein n=1 Tax=Piscirickettsia salmonis TaxID=1238 RepID=UPI003A7FC4F8